MSLWALSKLGLMAQPTPTSRQRQGSTAARTMGSSVSSTGATQQQQQRQQQQPREQQLQARALTPQQMQQQVQQQRQLDSQAAALAVQQGRAFAQDKLRSDVELLRPLVHALLVKLRAELLQVMQAVGVENCFLLPIPWS